MRDRNDDDDDKEEEEVVEEEEEESRRRRGMLLLASSSSSSDGDNDDDDGDGGGDASRSWKHAHKRQHRMRKRQQRLARRNLTPRPFQMSSTSTTGRKQEGQNGKVTIRLAGADLERMKRAKEQVDLEQEAELPRETDPTLNTHSASGETSLSARLAAMLPKPSVVVPAKRVEKSKSGEDRVVEKIRDPSASNVAEDVLSMMPQRRRQGFPGVREATAWLGSESTNQTMHKQKSSSESSDDSSSSSSSGEEATSLSGGLLALASYGTRDRSESHVSRTRADRSSSSSSSSDNDSQGDPDASDTRISVRSTSSPRSKKRNTGSDLVPTRGPTVASSSAGKPASFFSFHSTSNVTPRQSNAVPDSFRISFASEAIGAAPQTLVLSESDASLIPTIEQAMNSNLLSGDRLKKLPVEYAKEFQTESMSNLKDIDLDELYPDKEEYKKHIEKEEPQQIRVPVPFWDSRRGEVASRALPTIVNKKKHQINTLAVEALENQEKLLEKAARRLEKRRIQKSKYGW